MAKRTAKSSKRQQQQPQQQQQQLVPPIITKLLKLCVGTAVVVYGFIPVFVRLNPWILTEVVFLHRVRWPPFIDLGDPASIGLNHTRAFRIPSTDGVSLGAWHVLPHTSETANKVYSEEEFTNLLSLPDNKIVLYLHGNAGTKAGRHRIQLYRVFAKSGYHVVLIDYRGFGDSSGSPSEEGAVQDALAAYTWIKQQNSHASVIVWGHSLGSAIATNLVTRLESDPPLCLVLEAPFNNIQEAAFGHPLARAMRILPWFHWAFVETLDGEHLHFRTDENLQRVTVPTLILHATDDGIVPYALGEKLYETVKTANPDQDVEFFTFDGEHDYGHKHLWKAPNLPNVIGKFVQRVQQGKKKT